MISFSTFQNIPLPVRSCKSEAKQYVNFSLSTEDPHSMVEKSEINVPPMTHSYLIHSREIYLGQCLGIIRRYALW